MDTVVSIVIPCYNSEKYIEQTIRHIEAQTFGDIEIVCVNDGSADDTLSVLEKLSKTCTVPMKVFTQENAGVSAARNRGIRESAGRYILFCDADDCLHSRMTELLVNGLEQNGTDVSYCLLSREPDCLRPLAAEPEITVKERDAFLRDLKYRMGRIGFCCCLYKKETVEKNGLWFDVGTKHFEDREFNWKYLAHCDTAAFVPVPLYWYRKTENSATTAKCSTWRTDSIEAGLRVEAYYRERKDPFAPELENYLHRRIILGMAKRYAMAGAWDLLERLGREYDMKACMRVTAKDRNPEAALASVLYLLSPRLFYLAVKTFKK